MYRHIVLGALFATLVQAWAIGSFGLFLDSEIYYFIYKNITEIGFFETLFGTSVQTGKFEPLIVFLFYIQNLFFGGSENIYIFIFANLFILNSLLPLVLFAHHGDRYKNKLILMMSVGLLVSSYLIFSKNLYFWRNIYGVIFLLLFIFDKSWMRIIWFVLGFLSHNSIVIFAVLYLFTYKVYEANRRWLYVVGFLMLLISWFFIENGAEIFGFLTSGGNALVFTETGSAHRFVVLITAIFSIVIQLLVRKDYFGRRELRPLFGLAFVFSVYSLMLINSYHLMIRFFLPASLITGFLPFLVYGSNWSSLPLRLKLARVLVLLSILPTFRLLFLMATNQFTPE